jgi:hypothetical protein
MALEREQIKSVLDALAAEGNARVELAPVERLSRHCPVAWHGILTSEAAQTRAALGTIWGTMAAKIPKTLAAWKKILQGVAFVTTDQRPPSLLYFYRRDGEVYAYRGYAPVKLSRREASLLPPTISEFYQVHNGLVDVFSWAMGPLPEPDWHYLSDDPSTPAGSFLVLFNNGGGASAGFDLSEEPALSYIVWPDDPPNLAPDFWGAIDDWMATGLEGADRA